jgi:chromosome segregation ATPase
LPTAAALGDPESVIGEQRKELATARVSLLSATAERDQYRAALSEAIDGRSRAEVRVLQLEAELEAQAAHAADAAGDYDAYEAGEQGEEGAEITSLLPSVAAGDVLDPEPVERRRGSLHLHEAIDELLASHRQAASAAHQGQGDPSRRAMRKPPVPRQPRPLPASTPRTPQQNADYETDVSDLSRELLETKRRVADVSAQLSAALTASEAHCRRASDLSVALDTARAEYAMFRSQTEAGGALRTAGSPVRGSTTTHEQLIDLLRAELVEKSRAMVASKAQLLRLRGYAATFLAVKHRQGALRDAFTRWRHTAATATAREYRERFLRCVLQAAHLRTARKAIAQWRFHALVATAEDRLTRQAGKFETEAAAKTAANEAALATARMIAAAAATDAETRNSLLKQRESENASAVSALEARIAEADEEITALRRSLLQLAAECNSYKGQAAELQLRTEDAEAVAASLTDAKSQAAEMEASLATTKTELERMKSTYLPLQQRAERAEAQVQLMAGTVEKLTAARQDLEAQLAPLSDDCLLWRTKAQEQEAELGPLRARVSEFDEAQIQVREARLFAETKERENVLLRDRVEAQASAFAEAEGGVAGLTTRAASLAATTGSLAAVVATVEAQKETAKQQMEAVMEAHGHLLADLQQTKEGLGISLAQRDELAAENERLRRREAFADEWVTRRGQYDEERGELQRRVAELSEELNVLRPLVSSANARMAELTATAKNRLDELQLRYDTEVGTVRTSNDHLKAECASLSTEINAARADAAAARERAATLEGTTAFAVNAQKDAEAARDSAVSQMMTLSDERATLRENFTSAQEKLRDLQARCDDLTRQLKTAESRLKTAEEELVDLRPFRARAETAERSLAASESVCATQLEELTRLRQAKLEKDLVSRRLVEAEAGLRIAVGMASDNGLQVPPKSVDALGTPKPTGSVSMSTAVAAKPAGNAPPPPPPPGPAPMGTKSRLSRLTQIRASSATPPAPPSKSKALNAGSVAGLDASIRETRRRRHSWAGWASTGDHAFLSGMLRLRVGALLGTNIIGVNTAGENAALLATLEKTTLREQADILAARVRSAESKQQEAETELLEARERIFRIVVATGFSDVDDTIVAAIRAAQRGAIASISSQTPADSVLQSARWRGTRASVGLMHPALASQVAAEEASGSPRKTPAPSASEERRFPYALAPRLVSDPDLPDFGTFDVPRLRELVLVLASDRTEVRGRLKDMTSKISALQHEVQASLMNASLYETESERMRDQLVSSQSDAAKALTEVASMRIATEKLRSEREELRRIVQGFEGRTRGSSTHGLVSQNQNIQRPMSPTRGGGMRVLRAAMATNSGLSGSDADANMTSASMSQAALRRTRVDLLDTSHIAFGPVPPSPVRRAGSSAGESSETTEEVARFRQAQYLDRDALGTASMEQGDSDAHGHSIPHRSISLDEKNSESGDDESLAGDRANARHFARSHNAESKSNDLISAEAQALRDVIQTLRKEKSLGEWEMSILRSDLAASQAALEETANALKTANNELSAAEAAVEKALSEADILREQLQAALAASESGGDALASASSLETKLLRADLASTEAALERAKTDLRTVRRELTAEKMAASTASDLLRRTREQVAALSGQSGGLDAVHTQLLVEQRQRMHVEAQLTSEMEAHGLTRSDLHSAMRKLSLLTGKANDLQGMVVNTHGETAGLRDELAQAQETISKLREALNASRKVLAFSRNSSEFWDAVEGTMPEDGRKNIRTTITRALALERELQELRTLLLTQVDMAKRDASSLRFILRGKEAAIAAMKEELDASKSELAVLKARVDTAADANGAQSSGSAARPNASPAGRSRSDPRSPGGFSDDASLNDMLSKASELQSAVAGIQAELATAVAAFGGSTGASKLSEPAHTDNIAGLLEIPDDEHAFGMKVQQPNQPSSFGWNQPRGKAPHHLPESKYIIPSVPDLQDGADMAGQPLNGQKAIDSLAPPPRLSSAGVFSSALPALGVGMQGAFRSGMQTPSSASAHSSTSRMAPTPSAAFSGPRTTLTFGSHKTGQAAAAVSTAAAAALAASVKAESLRSGRY